MTTPIASEGKTARARGLDLARGLAVLAMIAYHFSWDLSHFGLIETDVGLHPDWKRFAQAIAASFLAIAGISLAFAARDGLDRRGFLKRLGKLAAAACLITAGTFVATPERFIFFGILHCIALSSVLALPFLRFNGWVAAFAGLAVLALPQVWTHPAFNHPVLIWLGLGTEQPLTNDFEPIFPWFGWLLLGLALGKFWLRKGPTPGIGAPGFLARLGRWSLPIYLLHQPILFGAFIGLGQIGAIALAPEIKSFVQSCAVDCENSGATYKICSTACSCVARTLRDRPLWKRVIGDRVSEEDSQELSLVGRRCYQASMPAEPLTKPAKEGP